jgi:hypothetical protein
VHQFDSGAKPGSPEKKQEEAAAVTQMAPLSQAAAMSLQPRALQGAADSDNFSPRAVAAAADVVALQTAVVNSPQTAKRETTVAQNPTSQHHHLTRNKHLPAATTSAVTTATSSSTSALTAAAAHAAGGATLSFGGGTKRTTNLTLLCTCKNSKCLKKYCVCFSAWEECTAYCSCKECRNVKEWDHVRRAAATKVRKNPSLVGCTCKNSKCLKKYCVCFAAKEQCSPLCTCIDCRNRGYVPPARKDSEADTAAAAAAMLGINQDWMKALSPTNSPAKSVIEFDPNNGNGDGSGNGGIRTAFTTTTSTSSLSPPPLPQPRG